MESLIYFVLGTLAAIIINLITPFLLRKLEEMNLVNRHNRRKTLEEELDLVTELHNNTSVMLATIARDLITLAGILASETIVIGTALTVQAIAYQVPIFGQVQLFNNAVTTMAETVKFSLALQNAAWIFLVVGYLLFIVLVSIALRALGLMNKVRRYSQYRQSVEKRIAQLGGLIHEAAGARASETDR